MVGSFCGSESGEVSMQEMESSGPIKQSRCEEGSDGASRERGGERLRERERQRQNLSGSEREGVPSPMHVIWRHRGWSAATSERVRF